MVDHHYQKLSVNGLAELSLYQARKKAGVLTFGGLFIVNLVTTLFDVSNVIHTHYKHLVFAYKSYCN